MPESVVTLWHDPSEPHEPWCSMGENVVPHEEIEVFKALPAAQFDALLAERARLVTERDEARAESAAVVCATQELAIGAGLPSVVVGWRLNDKGEKEPMAYRAEMFHGLMHALRDRVSECALFGRRAVKSHQDIDYVLILLKRARDGWKATLAGKPVRDADETLARIDASLPAAGEVKA